MAFHNTAARYIYSLGREGVLPSVLGKTHPELQEPARRVDCPVHSGAAWIFLFAIFNGTDDPTAQAYLGVYTLFAVLGTGLLLVLQAIVSLAIINYFRKNGGGNVFTTVIAPLVSFFVQVWLVYLLVVNLETFGGVGSFGSRIPLIALTILGVGFLWGLALKLCPRSRTPRSGAWCSWAAERSARKPGT